MNSNNDNVKISEVLKLYANSLEEKTKVIRSIRKYPESFKKISRRLDIQKCANEMNAELIHRSYCFSTYLRDFGKISENSSQKNIVDALKKEWLNIDLSSIQI